MNKIDLRNHEESSQILQTVGLVTLGSFWNNIKLEGDYWRFYHHDAPGAGVYLPEAEGGKTELRSGRCYLLPPHCDVGTWCKAEPEQLFIHFELSDLTGNPDRKLFDFAPPPAMAMRLERLRKLFRLEPERWQSPQELRLLTSWVVAEAALLLPQEAFAARDEDRRVRSCRNYLKTHLNENVTLQQLAERVQMSPNAFLRLFRTATGVAPYHYLLQLRYAHAALMLRTDTASIEEICETVGIADRFHFSRCFRQRFGMPPAAYRRHYSRKDRSPEPENAVPPESQKG